MVTATSFMCIFVKGLKKLFADHHLVFLVFVFFCSENREFEAVVRKGGVSRNDPGFGAQSNLVANSASTMFQTLKVGPMDHLLLFQRAPSSLLQVWAVSLHLSPGSTQSMLTLLLFLLHTAAHSDLLCILIWPLLLEKFMCQLLRNSFQNHYLTYRRQHTIEHFIICDVANWSCVIPQTTWG